ncbi:uncharacterized protein LOC144518767 [Sander vitreus]
MRVMSGTLQMRVWTLMSWRPQGLMRHREAGRSSATIKPLASRTSDRKARVSQSARQFPTRPLAASTGAPSARNASTLSARSTRSTGRLRNPSVPASRATIQTLTPARRCSSSLTRSLSERHQKAVLMNGRQHRGHCHASLELCRVKEVVV